ncbi:MAG: hypothetical protein JSS20_16170, partial [Proteobacteria bacterium]|nr:hypothetical protein [Pseudomonadota bacterium]
MLLVACLVVGAGIVMLPRHDEQIAILADAHKAAEMVSMLEERLAGGDHDPAVLASLGRAYEATGDIRRAALFLERYTRLAPADGAAYGALARLYLTLGARRERLAALKRQFELKRDLASAEVLSADLYDNGEPGEAGRVLTRFTPLLTAENGLLVRLAEYRVAAGETSSAIALLMRNEHRISWRKRREESRERLILASLLVDEGRYREAIDLGIRWVELWNQAWQSGQLLMSIAGRTPASESARLADRIVAVHPGV